VKQGEYFQLRKLDKALNADVVKKAKARGSSPPWLKDHAGQLEDPEYVRLNLAERGFLKDLRLLALRRGNKILNDEAYLRGQLRLTPRTLTGPKVDRLCALGFLEAYDEANNIAANQLVLSLPGLENGEPHSRPEVDREGEEKEPKAVAVDDARDPDEEPELDTAPSANGTAQGFNINQIKPSLREMP
jgi:hypothetical protein